MTTVSAGCSDSYQIRRLCCTDLNTSDTNLGYVMDENFPQAKRKTDNRSFRINSDVLAGLEEEAGRKKVSVNTLVNQLLADYINVGRHRLRLGSLSLSISAFKLMIGALSDEDISKMAAISGRNIPRAYASSKWGTENADNVMSFIK